MSNSIVLISMKNNISAFTSFSRADYYDVHLVISPTEARADARAAITATAVVSANTEGYLVEDLDIVFKVVEGDAFFTGGVQSLAAKTDASGNANATFQCGIPEQGYVLAILKFSDQDKKSSVEIPYRFVQGYPSLDVKIIDTNGFANGKPTVGVQVSVVDDERPAPAVHVVLKLSNTTAVFADGSKTLQRASDRHGLITVNLVATTAQLGYVKASVKWDSNVRATKTFKFIPAPKLSVNLLNNYAPADGHSAITAVARVVNAEVNAEGIAGVKLQFSVWGAVAVSGVDTFNGTQTLYTDAEGYARLSFTSITRSSQVPATDRLVLVSAAPEAGDTSGQAYGASTIYTFS